jgi:tetratricopeptide (TPR) repeat protein
MMKSVLIWLLVLVSPVQLLAGKVNAKLVDQDKKAISNGQSKLVEKNSGKEYGAKMNNKGDGEFAKVEAGEYQLHGHADGHMMNKSDWITVGDKDVSVTLMLVSENFYRTNETEGNTALTQGRFAEAVQRYQELLALVPNEGILWSNLAKAYVGTREPQKAREAAQKAASLDPKQHGTLETQIKGWLSFEEGRQALEARDFPKAVEALTEAVSADPSSADAYYALALAYGHQKKYPEALKNIDAALKLKPDDAGFLEVKRILTHNAGNSGKQK